MTTLQWLGALGGAALVAIGIRKVMATTAAEPVLDTTGGTTSPWWTADDFRALSALSRRLGLHPADVLLFLWSESGGNPQAAYRKDGIVYAAGLNQLTKSGVGALGVPPDRAQAYLDAHIKKSVAQQLPIVEQFLRTVLAGRANPPTNAAVLYAMNFAPSRVKSRGDGANVALFAQGVDGDNYRINQALDKDKDGVISIGDMGTTLREVANRASFKGALAALRTATGDANLTPRFG